MLTRPEPDDVVRRSTREFHRHEKPNWQRRGWRWCYLAWILFVQGCSTPHQEARTSDPLPIASELFADGRNGFTDVRAAEVVFDSLIAVSDNHSGKVFLLRGTEILKEAGRRGRGPLEFLGLASLVSIDDAFVVFDRREQRMTVLDSDLALVREVRVPIPGLFFFAYRLGPRGLALTEAAARADKLVLWTNDILGDSLRWRSRPVLEMVPAPAGKIEIWDGTYFGGGRSGELRLGWPREAYVIHSLDLATGERRIAAHRDVPAPHLTLQEAEAARERSARARELIGENAVSPNVDVHPHFGMNVEDRCGRLWILTRRGGDSHTIVDLFEPDGSFVREVSLGARVAGIAGLLARPQLVTIITDEMDRRGIALFDLPPSLRCGQG